MITRWFVGVKQESKGFFKGFTSKYFADKNTEVIPHFTKQSALAKSFTTKEDAEAYIGGVRKTAKMKLDEYTTKLNNIKDVQAKGWVNVPFDEQCAFLKTHGILVPLADTVDWRGNTRKSFLDLRYQAAKQPDHHNFIKAMDFTAIVTDCEFWVEFYQNQVDFIDTKLIIRQQELELKFMEKERLRLKWETRRENETSSGYCNCCGGAVPNIPQLRIGSNVSICAICMGKLAEEALIQAGKIDPDIMDHYQKDRFLRSI